MPEKTLTVEEAAKLLQVSEDTIYRHVRHKRLRVLPRIIADMEGQPLTRATLLKLAANFPPIGRPKHETKQ